MKIVTTLAFILLASPVQAQLVCDARTKITTELLAKYSESKSGFGISLSGKQMFELFTSKTGSWTILLTHPNGTSCAMAAGNSWVFEKPKKLLTPG